MLFNYINLIPNCIPEKTIDFLLNFKDNQSVPGTVGNLQISNSRIVSNIILPNEVTNNISEAFKHLYYNNLIQIYKKEIISIETPQFLHYREGGKYIPHNDAENFVGGKLVNVLPRDLTIIVYLNDNFIGGELEILNWNVTFKPKKGSMICFPSYIDFTHQVHPVISGERFNIVAWMKLNDYIYPRPYQK